MIKSGKGMVVELLLIVVITTLLAVWGNIGWSKYYQAERKIQEMKWSAEKMMEWIQEAESYFSINEPKKGGENR